MAKNRIFANGRFLTLTVSTADAAASSDFESGKPIVAGDLPGVCLNDMSTANVVTIDTQGVYSLTVHRPTTVGDGRVGSVVYWDPTNIRVSLPTGTTVIPSTGNVPFGAILDSIAAANSSADTTGVRVRLNGVAIPRSAST